MRICIDTRDLRIAQTGSRTYLEELCWVFPKVTDEHEFIFLTPSWQLPPGNTRFHKMLNHLAFYWWKEFELPWRAWHKRCNLIFCTDYVVPFISFCQTIPVFHDAGFWERSGDYNRYWLKLLNAIALPAARKSAAVITVSHSAKERIAKQCQIEEKLLKVVYEAPKTQATKFLKPDEINTVLRKYNLDLDKPYILHVGVMEKRKNLPRFITAFAKVTKQLNAGIQLVLVGQPAPKIDMDDSPNINRVIDKFQLQDSVILTGYVPDEDLPAFYQSALMYTFPSLYEGFGLPILEAFANNVPLIVSNATSLPEIAGEAALYFDPLNVKSMTEAILRLVTDEELRANLVVKGQKRLQDFSWQKTASRLLEVFEYAESQRS